MSCAARSWSAAGADGGMRVQGAPAPPASGGRPLTARVRAAAPFERPRGERVKLVFAIVGLALTTLVGLTILGYLGPIINFIYALWGLLGALISFGALVGLFVAFLAFLLKGKRAEPAYESPATIDSLDTKQS
jgi:hypothetical protein